MTFCKYFYSFFPSVAVQLVGYYYNVICLFTDIIFPHLPMLILDLLILIQTIPQQIFLLFLGSQCSCNHLCCTNIDAGHCQVEMQFWKGTVYNTSSPPLCRVASVRYKSDACVWCSDNAIKLMLGREVNTPGYLMFPQLTKTVTIINLDKVTYPLNIVGSTKNENM